MNRTFYPRLAVESMKKNKQVYLPYILTCSGMVMMLYIIASLAFNPAINNIHGGEMVGFVLTLGIFVIAIFAAIFLFYTNSFLIKRRKKEFGLYNILGMGKRNLAHILVWESTIIYLISTGLGLGCGMLFSKAVELLMTNMLGGEVSFTFYLNYKLLLCCAVTFFVIFVLIFLHTLRQIHLSNPLELFSSEAVGEKPPKANNLDAAIGLLLLAVAYCMAVAIEHPYAAIMLFFMAVIMVIVATYLLFISGSVAMCKLLQKNKRYYYKTNHFVSVSSLTYRMKRNGAGLAAICVLSTMVLVMLSSTISLYAGTEQSIRNRYPRNVVIEIKSTDENYIGNVIDVTNETLSENGVKAQNVLSYQYLSSSSYVSGNKIDISPGEIDVGLALAEESENIYQLFMIPLKDYNRITNSAETLTANEVIVYSTKSDFNESSVDIEEYREFTVKKKIESFIDNGSDTMSMFPSLFIIVPDMSYLQEMRVIQTRLYGAQQSPSDIRHYYGFDLDCEDEQQIEVSDKIMEAANEIKPDEEKNGVTYECAAAEKSVFLATFGGLLFLGILLAAVFITATVLIMYYKQISEGYEDRSRFEIMQKVGMTQREIKKSINSQLLTVFFTPLIAAGIHMVFAFVIIARILTLFGLFNTFFFAMVTVCCFLTFAFFYVLVYILTSRAYYKIVSSGEARG